MKKKLLSIFLIFSIILVMGACSKPTPDDEFQDSIEYEDDEGDVEEYTESDIDWYSKTYSYTDTDGYVYEIEWKYSPWMLLSTKQADLESAWREVGNGNDLPGFDDWQLKTDGSTGYVRQFSSGNPFIHHMTDMYYCVGEVSVRNVTDGWSISEDQPKSIGAYLAWEMDLHGLKDVSGSGDITSIGRIYYSDGYDDNGGNVIVSPKMTSDSWGPAAFILMAPENITPNSPDGLYYERMTEEGVLHFGPGSERESIDVLK